MLNSKQCGAVHFPEANSSVNACILFLLCMFFSVSVVVAAEKPGADLLRFKQGENDSFSFDTGVLKGVLRQEGKSTGLVPVIYKKGGLSITTGEGLFNHYRVFARGKRYGYGARRWPSNAVLHKDGSVEVIWPVMGDRPFELRAIYRWVSPNTIDLTTIVQARERLDAFEVFLASYFTPSFNDSQVWTSVDPHGKSKEGFVSADQSLGDWLAFPRDKQARAVIEDGRWDLEPHPLEWTMMPAFGKPLAIRRDKESGLTVVVITRVENCFGVFTPYGEEKHFSNYLSLFGNDIQADETIAAISRLVVLSNTDEKEIIEIADAFLGG